MQLTTRWTSLIALTAVLLVGCGSGNNAASTESTGGNRLLDTATPTGGHGAGGGSFQGSSQGGTGAAATTGKATGGAAQDAGTANAFDAGTTGGSTSAVGGASTQPGSTLAGNAGTATVSDAGTTGGATTSSSAGTTGGVSTSSDAGTTGGATIVSTAGTTGGATTVSTTGASSGGTTSASDAGALGGAGTGGLTNRPNIACGNGVVDPGEDCDDGNTREDDGCTTSCRYGCYTVKDCADNNPCTADSCGPAPKGFACTYETLLATQCDDGDACTTGDTCDATATCHGGTNICACKVDNDCKAHENGNACNGTLHCVSGQCELNAATVVKCDTANDTDCRKSVCDPTTGVCSVVNATEGAQCDDGLFCTATDACHSGTCVGTSDPCQGLSCVVGCDETQRHCVAAAHGATCRIAAGTCDVAEQCDGITFDCPADARVAGGVVCRAASGACDIAEKCNGISTECPQDAVQALGAVCRAATGACDVAEFCDGSNRDCPLDAFAAAGSVCRAKAGDCDLIETCSGNSGDCPPDALADATTSCRAAVGPCDVGENCTGASAHCPPDTLAASGTVCRAAASQCDATEVCTGATAACPENAFLAAGTPCNDGLACTVQDSCNATGQCSVSTPLAPPAPKPLWPANGWITGSATGAPMGSFSLRPTLRWEAAASDGCGALTYDVQMDDSCVIAALKTCAFPSPELSVSGIATTSFEPDTNLAVSSSLPMGTKYAWRVRACRSGVCSAWTQPRYLTVGRAANDFNGDGYSDLAIGAPEDQGQGSVSVFYGSAAGIVAANPQVLVPEVTQAAQAFGAATAAGDFDGDGYADLAVGIPSYDNDTCADVGRVVIFRGGPSGLEATPSYHFMAVTPETGAQFGSAVSLEGDIDGDGMDDLAIGEPLRDTAQVDEGIVSIHLGHPVFHARRRGISSGDALSRSERQFRSSVNRG